MPPQEQARQYRRQQQQSHHQEYGRRVPAVGDGAGQSRGQGTHAKRESNENAEMSASPPGAGIVGNQRVGQRLVGKVHHTPQNSHPQHGIRGEGGHQVEQDRNRLGGRSFIAY